MSVTRLQHTFPDGMLGTAVLSDDGLFRYSLSRIWDEEGPMATIVMLNPSKATHKDRDATIAKLTGFGKSLGWGGFVVVNLWAFRATEPADLRLAGFPIGPENDFFIELAVTFAQGPVICAWGSNPRSMRQTARAQQVLDLIRGAGRTPMTWRISVKGDPWHPLYIPYDAQLVELP